KLTAFPLIQSVWASIDARGLALHPSGQRLYLVTDNPPTLLVLDIDNFQSQGLAPAFTLVRGVPLPAGPNDIQVIPRARGSPLVGVGCAIDGAVVVYDDDLGQIAALVPGVGAVPFALAVDRRGDVARIYVSNFGDGRVAVIDVPVPGGSAVTTLAPRIVGHIGLKQYCLLQTDDRNCVAPSPSRPAFPSPSPWPWPWAWPAPRAEPRRPPASAAPTRWLPRGRWSSSPAPRATSCGCCCSTHHRGRLPRRWITCGPPIRSPRSPSPP